MSSVQEFITEATKAGFARTNKFKIIINSKSGQNVADQGGSAIPLNDKYVSNLEGFNKIQIGKRMQLYTHAVEFPPKVLATFDTPFRKMPYDQIYEPISITFKVSQDMIEKKVLDGWVHYIIDPLSDYVKYQDDYSRDIEVVALDNNNNEIYKILLADAYPSAIASTPLAYEENDNLMLVTYTFTYRYWEPKNPTRPDNVGFFENIQDVFVGGAKDIVSAIRTGNVSDLKAPINSILKTTKGLLDLDQGETLNLFNQLNKIVEDFSGVSINEGRRFVESVKSDIDSITDTNILSGGNKNLLSGAATNILNIF